MKADIDTPPHFCSINSISAGEPLYGSAPRTDYWLLLEHPHPPQAKALEESKLPAQVNNAYQTCSVLSQHCVRCSSAATGERGPAICAFISPTAGSPDLRFIP